jgi:hypothetical protein
VVVFDDQNVASGGEHLGQACGPLLVPGRTGRGLCPRGEQHRPAATGERGLQRGRRDPALVQRHRHGAQVERR